MYQDHNAAPVNPLPPVLILLCVALGAVEPFLYLQKMGFFGGIAGLDGRSALLQDFALPAGLLSWMAENGQFDGEYVKRFVTHLFVDVSFMSTAFVLVFTLAMGNFVARALGAGRFALLFFVPAFGGAIVYSLLSALLGFGGVLFGGMAGAFGLIGAFTWLMWMGIVRHPMGATSPFALIGFLVGFRVVMAPVFGWHWSTVAEWAAFLIGFGLTAVLVPGGWAHLVARLRKR